MAKQQVTFEKSDVGYRVFRNGESVRGVWIADRRWLDPVQGWVVLWQPFYGEMQTKKFALLSEAKDFIRKLT